jgi:hypothetical protein
MVMGVWDEREKGAFCGVKGVCTRAFCRDLAAACIVGERSEPVDGRVGVDGCECPDGDMRMPVAGRNLVCGVDGALFVGV